MSEKNDTTEKNQKIEKVEKVETPEQPEGRVFLFPTKGVAITADSRKEAEKIYKENYPDKEESDNG